MRVELCRGLVLRRHAVTHRHTSVLPTGLLLLLEVLVVGHLLLLFVGHVSRVHGTHVGLLSVDIGVADILRSLCGDVGGIDAILTRGRVRGI